MASFFQIDRKTGAFYDPMKRSFTAHHIRMYPMFNTGNISAVGTKLHHKDVPNGGRKMGSLVQSAELQRNLSLVSPGGFLFRLNKGLHKEERVQPHRLVNIKRDKKRIHDKTSQQEFFSGVVSYDHRDVSSIIQNSILQRRNLALKSPSRLQELRVEGANKFLLKAEDNLPNERLDALSIDFKTRKDGPTLLPQLKKPQTMSDLDVKKRRKLTDFKTRYSPLSIKSSQILLRQPEISTLKELDNCPEKQKTETTSNTDYASDVLQHESNGTISKTERPQTRRTINVFLPAISTEEEL